MTKPVGGRGYKAPYTTTHVRVPTDIKPQVEALIDNYRSELFGVRQTNLLTTTTTNSLPTLEEGIELAQEVLDRKQSARKSIALLLKAIYGKEVSL
jgi:hypothetical protein